MSDELTIQNVDQESFNKWFDNRLEQKLQEREEAKTPQLSLIATKGTMDMAYPPFILASTAAALGWGSFLLFYFLWLKPVEERIRFRNFSTWQSSDADENAIWSRLV